MVLVFGRYFILHIDTTIGDNKSVLGDIMLIIQF